MLIEISYSKCYTVKGNEKVKQRECQQNNTGRCKMKINKIFHALVLFSLFMGISGIQPTQALGTPQIVSINPPSPAQVGTCIAIRVRVDWDSEYRSMRVRFGPSGWEESSETEFQRQFCTNGYNPGWYTIRVEVARQGDNNWSNPAVTESQYQLVGDPGPDQGPRISQFSFNPSSGAKVGNQINIHIKVDSNNPGATKINVGCGGVSKEETSEVEFDSTWRTNGCSAESYEVLVCSRAVNDPNWTKPTCATKSYLLSPADVEIPVPTIERFKADNYQISNGQCTYLHWQTSNADRVDIDGNGVQSSGSQQVCPTVTKKYTLSATNQSGTANRNLTIIVSDEPASENVAASFQTGDIIQIGYDIYVIVDGERRLIPNPETLDALGISRSQINNKGFSDDEMMTIPEGKDVPDVNRDPQGFADFKNMYFPNTTPIIPNPGPSDSNQPNRPQNPGNNPPSTDQWRVGARVSLCKGTPIRDGSGFRYGYSTVVPQDNWQVDIIGGPRYADGVTWWDVSRRNLDGGGTGWVVLEQATNCGSVLGDNTQNDYLQTPSPIEPSAPQESDDCSGLIPCAQASDGSTTQPKVCVPLASCGKRDIFCQLKNWWIQNVTNKGCLSTPSIPAPQPEQQTTSGGREQITNDWLGSLSIKDYKGNKLAIGSCTAGVTVYSTKDPITKKVTRVDKYPCQCVQFAKDITNFHSNAPKGSESLGTASGYYNHYNQANGGQKLSTVVTTRNDKLTPCDILIWPKSTYSPSGHMAIVYDVTKDQIYYVDQNSKGSTECYPDPEKKSDDPPTYICPGSGISYESISTKDNDKKLDTIIWVDASCR
jgi:hypothetical protein